MNNILKSGRPEGFTDREFSILFGILLGDAWIEVSSPTSNARLGFSFTIKTELLFDMIHFTFKKWITSPSRIRSRIVPDSKYTKASKQPNPQKTVRTVYDKIFVPIHRMFYILEGNSWRKVIPSVPVLTNLFTPLAFAYLLLCDGSRKSKQTYGYKIHLQGLGFEGVARICIVLYEKWGIKAWPTLDNAKKKGVNYWIVYIASSSFPIWGPMVETEIKEVGMFDQKMPLIQGKAPIESRITREAHRIFMENFSNNELIRNDTCYKLSPLVLNEYHVLIKELRKKPG